MSKASRDKGGRGEREFANLLSQALGTDIVRNLNQPRDGGWDFPEVSLFEIEVRFWTEVRPDAWWREVCDRPIADGKYPALAYRQNRKPWRVIVPLRFFRPAGGDEPVTLTFDGFVCVVRAVERQA